MENFIQKINFYHSLIFFLIVNLCTIIIDQNENLDIAPTICLILILTVGISHGSLDHIKGKKLFKIFKIDNTLIFYISYISISISLVLVWLAIPEITLFLFLIIASYHFGKEDTYFIIDKNLNFKQLLFLLKGLLIVIAPLNFHFTDTINIFKILFVESERFYSFLGLIEDAKVIPFTFIFITGASFYLFIKNFKTINLIIFFDFFSIMLLNYYFKPLLAFTFYFCFLHSIRHTLSLATDLDQNSLKAGLFKFLKKAIPLTILTIIISLIILFYLSNSYLLDNAILKLIFIGLASLTFPHILLEYLLEKNEK